MTIVRISITVSQWTKSGVSYEFGQMRNNVATQFPTGRDRRNRQARILPPATAYHAPTECDREQWSLSH